MKLLRMPLVSLLHLIVESLLLLNFPLGSRRLVMQRAEGRRPRK